MIRNDKAVFVCPYCDENHYPNPDSLKRPVKKKHDNSNSDDDSLVEDDAVNVILDVKTMPFQSKDQTKDEDNIKRLSAFNALQQPEKEQEKKLLIAKLGDLEPAVYVDREGIEHHLLAAPKVISNMMTFEVENQLSSFISIPKKKKKIDGDNQPDLLPCSIRNIILDTYCRTLLSKPNYIQLDH